MKVIERNLQEIGKSLLVTLPKAWTKSLDLKKGSKIKMMVSEKGSLFIAPEFSPRTEKRETSISYDKFFERKFFREYFFTNEKITINFNQKLDPREKKQVYDFLKKFINVQIIEDSSSKVIVKCFKIDDLTINECLKRMHFLSLGLFDEKNLETKKTSKQFYYMLVMQIRRFLCEGQYTHNNDVSLLRILDLRMASEKISLITNLALGINEVKNKELATILSDVKEYYKKSFQHFVTNNYNKAIQLWDEEKKIQKRLNKEIQKIKKSNDIDTYQQAQDVKHILLHAKAITMHVRGTLN